MLEAIGAIAIAAFGAAISKITEHVYESYKRREAEKAIPRLATMDDVLQWGWTGETLLTKLIDLDRRLIGDSLTDEIEGTVDQWAPVFMAHPETWVLLTTGPKNIVGYWHFVALRDEVFQRALSGELQESQITLDSVVPLDVPGVYNLYFTLLGVLPTCPGGGSRLIEAFYTRLEELAHRGVIFRGVGTNAATKDGTRICDGFGMKALGPNKVFGTIYHMSFIPWPERLRFKRWDTLRSYYEHGHPEQKRPDD
jgi:hypothetical protein